jgi:hypothetical protein
MSDLLLIAAVLALASSESFVDYLDEEANGSGIDLVEVDSYFIWVGFALPAAKGLRMKWTHSNSKYGGISKR